MVPSQVVILQFRDAAVAAMDKRRLSHAGSGILLAFGGDHWLWGRGHSGIAVPLIPVASKRLLARSPAQPTILSYILHVVLCHSVKSKRWIVQLSKILVTTLHTIQVRTSCLEFHHHFIHFLLKFPSAQRTVSLCFLACPLFPTARVTLVWEVLSLTASPCGFLQSLAKSMTPWLSEY